MSCLSGASRPAYGLDLDILKSPSPSPSPRSSSPSSTLSEASNSPHRISTKRARTPRKRPNQTYSEAAALLSTVYPKVFSTKNLGKLCNHTRSYDSYTESSELLPSFPALNDAGFLIGNPPDEKPIFRIEVKPVHSLKACRSDFPQPGSPAPLEDDFEFDTESILDEEIEEGIDSIMGNLSMNNNGGSNEEPMNYNGHTNPLIRSLMGFGSGRKFELGFGFGLRGNLRRALRRVDDGEWWRTPTVSVQDIVPKFKALPSPSSSEKKKKKKKKVEKEEAKELPASAPQESSRTGLLLKLNYEDVLKEWSDRGSPFSDAELIGGSPESSTDLRARLAEIDLFPEMAGGGDAGGVREASVMRYKEKRRSRLFSKKIRYQVRKVNADQRPRMKASGRFVKRPSLLKEAIEEISQ